MFQNGQKVVVVSGGDAKRVVKVQSASGTPDPSRYPIVDTTGVTGRDQQVQIVSGGDATRFPILRGVSDARATADSVITALTPAAWYRNATGVTSAGGFASQWDDYSGNTRHLVQATGTNQPAYAAGVFTFDGADNFMSVTGGFTLTQPETVVIVLNQVSWAHNKTIFDGNVANSMRLYQGGDGGANTANQMVQYAGDYGVYTTGQTTGTFVILISVFNGASSLIRVNNTADFTAGGTAGANNGGGFRLAGFGDAFSSGIQCKEVIIFPSAISDANRTSLVTALNNALTVF